jgi:hypothetical protein
VCPSKAESKRGEERRQDTWEERDKEVKPKDGNKSRTKERKKIIKKKTEWKSKDRNREAGKLDKDGKGVLLKLFPTKDFFLHNL